MCGRVTLSSVIRAMSVWPARRLVVACFASVAAASAGRLATAQEPPAAAAPAATQPALSPEATLPKQGEPDFDPVYDKLRASPLPKDVPLPEHTPYDDDPARRTAFLKGYRHAFVARLMNGYFTQLHSSGDKPSAETEAGERDGEEAASRVVELRNDADRTRRNNFHKIPSAHEVLEDSTDAAEREVLRRFHTFAGDFVTRLRALYPPTLVLAVAGEPRVYAYTLDDYSRDNTGTPRPLRAYKGVLWPRAVAVKGHRTWLVVRIIDEKKKGENDEDLEGDYSFKFDYQEVLDDARGRWSWDNDYDPTHWHPAGVNNRRWRPVDSSLARELINKAVEQAQHPPPPATEPSP